MITLPKNLHFFLLLATSLTSNAQLLDTTVEGVLRVETDSLGMEGNLSLDGAFRAGRSPVDFSAAFIADNGLSRAQWYGPISFGNRYNMVEMVFEKSGDQAAASFIDLPIALIGTAGNIEVSCFVTSVETQSHLNGHGEGAYADAEYAYWNLAGPRHTGVEYPNGSSSSGDTYALEHLAYGAGRDVSLKSFRFHSRTYLRLTYNDTSRSPSSVRNNRLIVRIISSSGTNLSSQSLSSYKSSTVGIHPGGAYTLANHRPVIHCETLDFMRLTNKQAIGNGAWEKIEKKFFVDSFIVDSKKTELRGEVVLSQPQGDISMGAFGSNP